jgi:hypothetical protein
MNVGDKVIYGLYTPKIFVNFSNSLYLCFMHLNKFFLAGVCRFHQTGRGVHGTRKVQNPCFVALLLAYATRNLTHSNPAFLTHCEFVLCGPQEKQQLYPIERQLTDFYN